MNVFGTKFIELYEKYGSYEYFKSEELEGFGEVLEFQAPADIYNNCFKIAREKAQYTMDYSQELKIRTPKEKVIKQFKGVLAETAIHLYLVKECGIPFDKVHRWDLERSSFRYSSNEYDLRFLTDSGELSIESRASDSYKTSLDEFVKKYDIIGKYSNSKKVGKKTADLYIRPVYQCESRFSEKEWKSKLYETFDMIQSRFLKLYLVSGATKEEMYGESGYKKNMSQGETIYQCLRITAAGDMNRISDIIRCRYAQSGGRPDGPED